MHRGDHPIQRTPEAKRVTPALTTPTIAAVDSSLDLELLDSTQRLAAADITWITAHASRAISRITTGGRVAVRIVADDEMAKMHEEFAGVAGTTDVLTFDLSDPEISANLAEGAARPVDTDILICIDEAERQAARRSLEPRQELLLYILHGVLHCIGHDDHDEAAFARMHAREDELMASLGLPTAFHAPVRTDAGVKEEHG